MKPVLRNSLYLLLILLTALACQKGDAVDQGNFMKVKLTVYHPDTAVYSNVSIGEDNLANTQVYYTDNEVYDVFLSKNWTSFQDSAQFRVKLTKTTNGNSLLYDSRIKFRNANDFLLFQTCPGTDPLFIDKTVGDATEVPLPTNDSIKVRFFFSTNDMISNPNTGYVGRLLSRMRLQIFTFTPNANPNLPPASSSFVTVYSALDFNACGLSDYITLARNKKYGVRIRDISPGIPGSAAANLVQQLLADADIQIVNDPNTGLSDWDFKKGKINLSADANHKFQTIRIKRSSISFTDRNGNDGTESSYNGQFILGLNRN
ncbi:MAG: hypothetical protein SFU20_07285 [Chitinophagaceae bacterium]|nr:hypothetical protein [Chitinophagaceae bacterium]